MNTRKYPRTMSEAFGPYTSTVIHEPPSKADWQDVVVIVASVVTALAALAIGVLA